MAGTVAGLAQAAAAVAATTLSTILAYHKLAVAPLHDEVADAMSTASDARQEAEGNTEELDALDDDLRDSINSLRDAIEELNENEQRRRREFRGQSYQLYVLAKTIDESDEMPDVPVPDEDLFLRGGSRGEDSGRFETDD